MGDDKQPEEKKKAANCVEDQAEQLVGGPVESRHCTDILCCLIFIAFNILMVVVAIDGIAQGEPYRLVAVWSSAWLPCGIKYNDTYDLTDYKYIYFSTPHPDWLNKTVCVKECPSYLDNAEKIKKYSGGLACDTNNQTALEENSSCKEMCGPFSSIPNSDTSTQGWSLTEGINWKSLFCIYNTTILMNRVCMPGAELFGFVEGLASGITSSINMDQLTSWMNDLDKGRNIVYASFLIVFVLGGLYMIFVRIFSGVIVWLCIVLFFILLAMLGIYVHVKSQDIETAIAENNGIEEGQNTLKNRDTYLYISYAIGITWLICLIGLMCLWNNIKLAIAVVKTATIFVLQTPTAMLIPPVMACVTIIWWFVWVVCFAFVYSVGDVTKRSEASIFAIVYHEQIQWYKIWGFIFGGLWINAFIQALTQFILASTCSIWYWSQPDGTAHAPILRSLYRAFRYHLGSLAFGSFILAVVQTIRLILEYVVRQLKQAGAEENKFIKYLIQCLRCFMACFERFVKFLNKIAYIQIALSGENFCTSAQQGMRMVWNNGTRVALTSGLGAAFIFIGKVFMICATLFITYTIYTSTEPYKTEMNSTFLPQCIIFCIAWGVSTVFMSIYGLAIDTILLCFLYDEEQNKGNLEGKMRAPPLLKEFFSDHDAKVDDHKKRLEAKKSMKNL